MGIYMSSNMYYYYTKGERSDADEKAYIRLTSIVSRKCHAYVCKPIFVWSA